VCSRLFLVRLAGIVQVLLSRFNSAQHMPPTSSRRAPVKISNLTIRPPSLSLQAFHTVASSLSESWAARRANPEPVVERIAHRFQLERALRGFERRGCTLAIIDTPGSDNDFVTDAIRAANLCLVPARPSQADIEAAIPTLRAIRRVDREFAFVLNQTPARGQRPTRVALALNEAGVLALPYIVLRNDHMDSLATDLAVSEFAPDSIAAVEIRALWAWSKQKLIMNDGRYFETNVGPIEDIKTRDDVFPSLLLA
jgi:chromosome partitioning protein